MIMGTSTDDLVLIALAGSIRGLVKKWVNGN
jgi:hypothetical protein